MVCSTKTSVVCHWFIRISRQTWCHHGHYPMLHPICQPRGLGDVHHPQALERKSTSNSNLKVTHIYLPSIHSENYIHKNADLNTPAHTDEHTYSCFYVPVGQITFSPRSRLPTWPNFNTGRFHEFRRNFKLYPDWPHCGNVFCVRCRGREQLSTSSGLH